MGYKAYSDSYLMSLTKAQIIELLRIAEHNFFAAEEALDNSAKAGMEIAEKYDRVKELLKVAVDDVETLCGSFVLCFEYPLCVRKECSCKESCKKWRYKAEALKLLNDEKINNVE